MKQITDVLYKIYYRAYYVLIANWIINHPKKVSPPTSFLYCRFYHDPNLKGCRHHNFLFVPKKYRPENKWLFWKRKFAFRIKGEAGWYQLPSLTIWEIGEKEIKYGINSLFVLNNIDHDIEYISYLS